MATTTHPKKLIEVALPLAEINAASAYEKLPGIGPHPRGIHLWWARRPLAAARAVLFGQLVDDPQEYADELIQDPKKIKAAEKTLGRKCRGESDLAIQHVLVEQERERLFDIIRDLVIWANTTTESLFEEAKEEIRSSWRRTCRKEGKPEDTPMPPVLDPFAGGGAIPLEAQRLGLEAHASDLNPVAVLINKAMIEIPPRFADRPPVHPVARSEMGTTGWKGAGGLAEDVRRYGEWMRDEARKRIGHLYPPYKLTEELVERRPDLQKAGYQPGDKLTVIAWLWARTVPSPNPALNGKHVPLVSTYWLRKKKGKEVYIEPIVDGDEYHFEIRLGTPKDKASVDAGTKLGRGANFNCLLSGIPIDGSHVKSSGKNGDLKAALMCVICEGKKERIYLPATEEHITSADATEPEWRPSAKLNHDPRNIWTPKYGLEHYCDLFTKRQLVALNTLCELVNDVRSCALEDAESSEFPNDPRPLEQLGEGAQAYADAVAIYLGFAISRSADFNNSCVGWRSGNEKIMNLFSRQAIPMVWDFGEANILANVVGGFETNFSYQSQCFRFFPSTGKGRVAQQNASTLQTETEVIISTDPPYYDNITYADLSDFFYVWLRRSLQEVTPDCLSTLLTPKTEEMIASPYRHGGAESAEQFFLKSMEQAVSRFLDVSVESLPITLYYAFKQSEIKDEGTVSTGWATFLTSIIESGLAVVATWPIRSEQSTRILSLGNSALASSIVLVCRKREIEAETATRREFVKTLQRELPVALKDLQFGNISPVDLPQSSIGPGIGVFSRYKKVIEADGSAMTVKTALQLINAEVSTILGGPVAEMDDWTRFAVDWFKAHHFKAGSFGDADVIARAYAVAVDGVAKAGILESAQNKVRIFAPDELPADWDPDEDDRLTVWEVVHHLIRALEGGGQDAAAAIMAKHSIQGEMLHNAKALCYYLFTICEEKKWAELGKSYNGLIIAWPDILKQSEATEIYEQEDLFS